MKSNNFIVTLLIATLNWFSGVAIAAEERPNIVLIISDDHAWTDYGFMGNDQVRTPNIDRLAAEGLTFRRGYVTSALCSPSLATLLTGLHPHQHGITGNDPARRQPREPWLERFFSNPMLPRLLADSGYLTMHTGKYWMRKPADAGFTDDMGETDRHGGQALGIGRETMQPVYDAIDKAKKQDKPFFLWYAPMMPHTPHNPPSRLLDKYQHIQDPAQAKYYAMIEWFDESCGALFEKLKSSGVDNNTLVLYLSDNGWNDFGKRTPYENGVRTPVILRWPEKIKPRIESDKLAENIDVFPTLLAAAGVASPKQTPGIDLLNEQAISQRDSIFLASFAHDMESVNEPEKSLISRTCIVGHWKLVDWWPNPPAGAKPKAVAKWQKNPDASTELFDLSLDPHEATNLSTQHPERVQQLKEKINQWWTGKATSP